MHLEQQVGKWGVAPWEREDWGVGPSTVGDSWLASSCLDRRPIPKVMPVLISTSKQASQHWAGDTCVAI